MAVIGFPARRSLLGVMHISVAIYELYCPVYKPGPNVGRMKLKIEEQHTGG